MRILLAIPLIFLLILFALSNKQPVALGIWPTDVSITLPLSIAILGIAGVFFLFGALVAWAGTLVERNRARRAEVTVRQLQAQLASRSEIRSESRSLSLARPG